MKKLLSVLLCLVLALGVFAACGGSEGDGGKTQKIESFSVGYAAADITPKESVPLRGYGDAMERFSKGFTEPLYATCVAFADAEGETMLFITHDLTNSPEVLTKDLRQRISDDTGLPVSHILLSASHSHSAPDYSQNVPSIVTYNEYFKTQVLQGAKDALADLAPATMETGFNRIDGLNTVRHYLLTDGSYQGKSVGTLPKSKLVGHYGKADNLLQVVKFTRQEKEDVVLVNWCGHPMGAGESLYEMAGPNYPGILRTNLEEKYGCKVAFVLGGSGNVNNGSQFEGEVRQTSYVELGTILADAVSDIIETRLTASKSDKITLEENLYTHVDKRGYDQIVPLYAFSLGDWACVTAPFEIFDTNTMAVRDASKFKMTFYATCANDSLGYLPTPPSFGWEITYEAQITKFPQGMAEDVQGELTKMLDNIFTASGNEVVDKGEGYNTPAFEPTTDDVVYYKLNDEATEVKNGFYSVLLSDTKTTKTMLCIDKETADKVLAQDSMKLKFNEQNVIVDVIPEG